MTPPTHSQPRPSLLPAAPAAAVRPYEPPRVVRVRVATARCNSGQVTGDQHCTRHWHDTGTCTG